MKFLTQFASSPRSAPCARESFSGGAGPASRERPGFPASRGHRGQSCLARSLLCRESCDALSFRRLLRAAQALAPKSTSRGLIPQDSREDGSGAVQLWGRSREKLRRFRCLDEQPILSHAAATAGSARASARGTLSDAQQQLLVRGSLSGQRPRRSERRRRGLFSREGRRTRPDAPG